MLRLLFRPDGGGTGGSGVSEIAEIKPSAAAPTPPAPDGRSAVEIASAEARARIAEGKPAVAEPGEQAVIAPVGDAAKVAADKAAADKLAADQARASDGTFAPPLPEEQQAIDDAAAAEKVVTIKLGDAETPIEFDDPAVATHVRERFEIAEQAEEIERQAREQIEDVMMVREAVNVDPVGFVLGEIEAKPAAVEHLVLTLLTRPAGKDLLAKVVAMAANPKDVELVAAQQEAARGKYKEDTTARIAEERAVSANLGEVIAALADVARSLPAAQQQVAFADFKRDVQKYAERHKLLTIEPQDLPLILAPRLTALGLDPTKAAQQMASVVAAKRAGKRAPARKAAAPAPAPKPAVVPPGTAVAKSGQSFVESAERRRAVTVPGSGAGSPGSGPADIVPPKNADGSSMSIEQVTQWHRERYKKGVRSY